MDDVLDQLHRFFSRLAPQKPPPGVYPRRAPATQQVRHSFGRFVVRGRTSATPRKTGSAVLELLDYGQVVGTLKIGGGTLEEFTREFESLSRIAQSLPRNISVGELNVALRKRRLR